jgi:hypothetical protein
MSKKKNTLRDLDEFLKQQAATLVSPSRISDSNASSHSPKDIQQETRTEISFDSTLHDLKNLSGNEKDFRKKFYELIIQTIETQSNSLPEDKMLINTALYLKHGETWKDAIRDYWKGRS